MPAHIPTPAYALTLAMWALRDRPANEKAAWRSIFDYYAFSDAATATAHIPEQAHGMLGPIDEMKSRQLRAMLINFLNR